MTPMRPGHPCATPGCPRIVNNGSHCAEHEATRRVKSPEQKKFYASTWWRKQSERVRREEPICQICGMRPSKVCDHIDGQWGNNARVNLRGICKPCDLSRTAKQHRRKQA